MGRGKEKKWGGGREAGQKGEETWCLRKRQSISLFQSLVESTANVLWLAELITAGSVHLPQLSFPLTLEDLNSW